MDFLDPKKKRAHKIRLFIGYGLMAIALGIATTILVFEAYGFDVNRQTGQVIQNGLIFVDSHPEPTAILLNGQPQGQTDKRLVVPAGDYTVKLERAGYRPWERSFTLLGASIERLVYPFLFPTTLSSVEEATYPVAPSFATQSPDRRWVISQQVDAFLSFDVYDTRTQPLVGSVLTIPDTILSPSEAPEGRSLELVEWSTNNRHVLVRHTYDGVYEFILIDREAPAESLNLNRHFNVKLDDVSLRDKSADKLYIYDTNGGVLRQADVSSKEITPVLTDVLAYKTHGDDEILYITDQDAPENEVFVRVKTDDTSYTIRRIPRDDTGYLLDIYRYDSRWYVAVGSKSNQNVYVYRNVFNVLRSATSRLLIPTAIMRLDVPSSFLSVSANSRFVGVQSGSEFNVYDAELDRTFTYTLDLPIPKSTKAEWMDGHRYTVIIDGNLRVFDFDGSNVQELVEVQAVKKPFFDRDYDHMFVFGASETTEDQTALKRIFMRTSRDR